MNFVYRNIEQYTSVMMVEPSFHVNAVLKEVLFP